MKECCREWAKIDDSNIAIDLDVLKEEFIEIAINAVQENPDAAAFVFECTDMPPFSNAVKKRIGLPVFDFVTMTEYIYHATHENH